MNFNRFLIILGFAVWIIIKSDYLQAFFKELFAK